MRRVLRRVFLRACMVCVVGVWWVCVGGGWFVFLNRRTISYPREEASTICRLPIVSHKTLLYKGFWRKNVIYTLTLLLLRAP